MKRLIILALAACPALLFAQDRTFTIKGDVASSAPAKVYLNGRSRAGGVLSLDSTEVKNGKFEFKGVVEGPIRAQLMMDHTPLSPKNVYSNKDHIDLYLDKGEILVHVKDSIKTAAIKGSKINDDFQAYMTLLASSELGMRNAGRDGKTTDSIKRAAARAKYIGYFNEWKQLQELYIKQNLNSYFSLVAINYLIEQPADLVKYEPAFKALSESVRSTPMGISFAEEINGSRNTQIGKLAPAFTQNDVNDKPVSLSDFKGKYVLIDFWASWCKPCRLENPSVVKAYNTYKEKNFTVLSVSLDQPNGKQAWLNAIEADGLKWTNVSDLKFWNNAVVKLYGVKSVPQNYLIDPMGKIIAINLRGDQLDHKLKALLDSK